MAIIKMEDIDRIYTEILTDYFTKGYRLYTKNMSGHQGERAKIDITNGKHILRIWMETFLARTLEIRKIGCGRMESKSTLRSLKILEHQPCGVERVKC